MDQIITGWTTREVLTVYNLRSRDGQWLIDVTYCERKKTETKIIGEKLSWEKISQLIPQAIFKKSTQKYLQDSRIVSFVRLDVKTLRVDRSKGGKISEVCPSSFGQYGVLLVNIETGNEIAMDIRKARIRNL
ncbi:MAG: hypothetical protein GX638_11065 [Crenarchaeota archaeon]|nr:hypothetical protein [Thermoproteota archaeon]